MITVKHGKCIELTPDTSEENNALISIFKDRAEVCYSQGVWLIEDEYVEWLNICLLPLKKILYIDSSFKVWKEKQKLVGVACIIRVGVISSKIIKGSQDIPHADIEKATRFFLKAAVNSPKFKDKSWDGYINLYKKWEKTFPTGLLSDVEKVLKRAQIKYLVEFTYNQNPHKEFDWKISDGLIPDPDQVEAINAGIKFGRGIIKAPTAFGKTAILAKRLIASHGVPSLFVANKKSLLDDAAKEFLTGINDLTEVATIKDGWFGNVKLSKDNPVALTAPVVVATIQSLHARLKDPRTRTFLLDWLRNVCKFVMVDECQATGTKIWDEVLDECYAPYRIFLSATPKRTDGATIKLLAGSGPVIFTTTAEEQILKGRLCELDIKYNTFDHKVYDDHDTDANYHETYTARISENYDRNKTCIINPTMEMLKEGRHVLVLIQYIEHGHTLKQMFMEAGIDPSEIRFIWGDTSDKARDSAISEFRKGEFKIMIGSTIFDAGVNIPIISGVVLGGAGNSDITLIQRIGRGARNCDYDHLLGYLPEFMKKDHGKKKTVVYDIMDINTVFFHKQSRNRYNNAQEEFGHDRVHVIGADKSVLKKSNRNKTMLSKQIDQQGAQLEMLREFSI